MYTLKPVAGNKIFEFNPPTDAAERMKLLILTAQSCDSSQINPRTLLYVPSQRLESYNDIVELELPQILFSRFIYKIKVIYFSNKKKAL